MNKRQIPFVVDQHVIKAYWLGKWRTLRYYGGSKAIPGKKIVEEAVRVFQCNAGLVLANCVIEPIWQSDYRERPCLLEHAYEA